MKCILTPNKNAPYNLRKIIPNQNLLSEYASEAALIEHVIERNKEVGVLESEAPYWIVDTIDLPDATFFDAWEWVA